jgi:AraC-like DNA-binding protein
MARSPSKVTIVPDDHRVVRVWMLRAMHEEGIGVNAIAARIGVSSSYVSRILNGERVQPGDLDA